MVSLSNRQPESGAGSEGNLEPQDHGILSVNPLQATTAREEIKTF
jgi:hypothetical protein